MTTFLASLILAFVLGLAFQFYRRADAIDQGAIRFVCGIMVLMGAVIWAVWQLWVALGLPVKGDC